VVLSLALLIMIIYMKNTVDFEEIITDLSEISKKLVENQEDEEWEKVFMDLVIDILSKGKNVLNEFVCSCFRRMSKFLGVNSVQVILEFLKEDLVVDIKNDVEMEESKENGNGEEIDI